MIVSKNENPTLIHSYNIPHLHAHIADIANHKVRATTSGLKSFAIKLKVNLYVALGLILWMTTVIPATSLMQIKRRLARPELQIKHSDRKPS